MRTATDEELLLASGRGDREAFALLVQRQQRAVLQFVHRFLATADRATAEDLAQQVFLSVWRYAPTFQPRAKVLTWLFRITTNACLNYRRYEHSRPSPVRLDDAGDAEQDVRADEVEGRLLGSERAQRVLNSLGAKLRGWLGGTLLSALFIAVLATAGLSLIGVKYAYVFGIVGGLLAFIPYFGSILAVVPPAFFALLDPANPVKALWVVLLFVVVQTVEANIFTPMVMQRRIDMPPAVVVLAVLVMGALLGFLGAVLALPLTLAVETVLDEFVLKKRREAVARASQKE